MRRSFVNNQYEIVNNVESNFTQQSTFTPNFLIGNNNVAMESSLSNHTKFPINSHQPLSPQDSKHAKRILTRHQEIMTRPQESVNNGAARSKGPPITNIWNKSPLRSSLLRTRPLNEENNASFHNGFNSNESISLSQTYNNIKDSEVYNNYYNSKNEKRNDDGFDNWVTIFGYGPDQAQHILGYFTQIGPIKNQIISNGGNWMHLQYESKMHSVSALNKNGKVINGLAMIGVKPCDDKMAEIPHMVKPCQMTMSSLNQSVGNVSAMNNGDGNSSCSGLKNDNNMISNNGSMRQLGTRDIFNSATSISSAPKRSFINRAMSMVFWRN